MRVRESTNEWQVEHVLVTLQQLREVSLLDLTTRVVDDLRDVYVRLRAKDRRWSARFEDIELLINPNGALPGKDLSHIDRAGAYAARHAALHAVHTGAGACQVTVAYAPNRDVPLEVLYEMSQRAERRAPAWFAHSAVRERYTGAAFVAALGEGQHFVDIQHPWNRACS